MKIKISDDLYDICWRVKAIDQIYDIYYNTKQHRYEVYYLDKLELVVPYATLDARTVDYVLKTRIERIEKIMQEIEENNLRIASKEDQMVRDEASYKAKSLHQYLSHHDGQIVGYEEL